MIQKNRVREDGNEIEKDTEGEDWCESLEERERDIETERQRDRERQREIDRQRYSKRVR